MRVYCLFELINFMMMGSVVSRILRISRSSGHELDSKNMQNKQGIGGGVLVDSLMLKLVREIKSVKNVSLAGVYFHIPFC